MYTNNYIRVCCSIGKEDVATRASVIRATTDSPMSPPACSTSKSKAPKSLLEIWLKRSEPKEKKPEFYGRLNSDGPKAKLYQNLKDPGREPREPMIEA